MNTAHNDTWGDPYDWDLFCTQYGDAVRRAKRLTFRARVPRYAIDAAWREVERLATAREVAYERMKQGEPSLLRRKT